MRASVLERGFRKRTAPIVALLIGLLLIPSATHAATVQRDGNTATGITNLKVGGATYDVVFNFAPTRFVYGEPPKFDFNSAGEAEAASRAVVAALNAAGGIEGVGSLSLRLFLIGWGVEGSGVLRTTKVWQALSGDGADSDKWASATDPDIWPYIDDGTWAVFGPAKGSPSEPDPEPEPEEPDPPEESEGAGFVRKQITCPKSNVTLRPAGSRFSINDIEISTNKDQAVTLKFSQPNKVLLKLFMKGNQHFETNLSGQIESENQQALKLDCSGNANTTLTITITGNGNL